MVPSLVQQRGASPPSRPSSSTGRSGGVNMFQQLLSAVKAKGRGSYTAPTADAVKKQSAVERPACRTPAGTRGRRGEL
jgi:hypothetical protein